MTNMAIKNQFIVSILLNSSSLHRFTTPPCSLTGSGHSDTIRKTHNPTSRSETRISYRTCLTGLRPVWPDDETAGNMKFDRILGARYHQFNPWMALFLSVQIVRWNSKCKQTQREREDYLQSAKKREEGIVNSNILSFKEGILDNVNMGQADEAIPSAPRCWFPLRFRLRAG